MSVERFIKKTLPWKNIKDCCSLWWDGIWKDCCCQHDVDYKYGLLPKLKADFYLAKCVMASGYRLMGCVMFIGVVLFGWIPWLNHRKRNLKPPKGLL